MKTLTFIILLCFATSLSAQTADERIANLMNQSDWLELNREFNVSKDSLSPFLRDFAKALLAHSLNRPDEAINAIEELLKKHQAEMGSENVINMVGCLTKNLSNAGRNEEAANMMENLYQQLRAGGTEEARITPYQRLIKEYRALAQCGELLQCNKPDKDIILPFIMDSVAKAQYAIRFQCLLNGKEKDFILDTGAGVCVVSPEVAKAHNMKMLDVSTMATGVQTAQGGLAIAEEFQLGEITLRNVPFYVLDMKTGHPEADKAMQHLNAIIGIPVINKLQEVQLDFIRNRMIVPQKLTPNPFKTPNLSLEAYDIMALEVRYNKERLKLTFDTGAGYSVLSREYFDHHKEYIETIGQKDSIRGAGFGGIKDYHPVYRMPGFCFLIGDAKGCVPAIAVETTDQQGPSRAGKDGLFGMNLFRAFSKMTINLKEMYVDAVPLVNIANTTTYDNSRLGLTPLTIRKLTPTDIILEATRVLLEWKIPQKKPGLLDK